LQTQKFGHVYTGKKIRGRAMKRISADGEIKKETN